VMAHVYSPDAIAHAVNCGVRSLEHCNLLDAGAADLVAEHDCFVVPTLITYDTMTRNSDRFGLTAAQIDKLNHVMEAGSSAVELCVQKGIPMGLGTDLLGSVAQRRQSEELLLRGDIQSSHEVLKSATAINAQLLQASGDIGEITAGARADILVVEADPLADISILTRPEETLCAIMKDGVFYKNQLA
jgi:imidazolonepropionase-like amidohydrolase